MSPYHPRAAHWAHRLRQMLANVDSCPYWQFRTVDDGRDPPDCQVHHGRIERFDSAFWQAHNPANCTRVECRCTVRACRPDEIGELKSKFGPNR